MASHSQYESVALQNRNEALARSPHWPPAYEPTEVTPEFTDTNLFKRWYAHTQAGEPNDYVIAVTPSSKTSVSGTGKTTLALALGKRFDRSPDGFDAESKATLDAGTLAYDLLPYVETSSAAILDEAQGAPGTDSMNARRGMKQESIDAINAILANRNKRISLVIIGQQLGMLDVNLYPIIDSWLLIRKGADEPDGPLVSHYKLIVDDFDLKNPKIKTPFVEDLTWPKIPHDDQDYVTMERKKGKAKTRRSENDVEHEELPKEDQMQLAQDYRNNGRSLEWIANNVESITYSRETIRKNTDDPA